MTAQHKLRVFLGLKPRFFLGRFWFLPNILRKPWPKVFVRNVWVRCLIGEAGFDQACGNMILMYIQLGLKLHVCIVYIIVSIGAYVSICTTYLCCIFVHVHIMYIRYFTLCMIVIVYAAVLMYGGCSRATLADQIFFLGS